MKIPTSSSIILATLAISSSSTSLAAPTGDGTMGRAIENEERSTDTGMMERGLGDTDLQGRNLPGMSLTDVLNDIPIVGPLLRPMLANLKSCPDPANPSAQGTDPDPAQMQRVQEAAATMSSLLSGILPSGLPVPGLPIPVPGVPGVVPTDLPLPIQAGADGDPSANPSGSLSDAGPSASAPTPAAAGEATDNGSSFLVSPTTTVANAEAVPTPQDSGVPAGPPNTPIPVSSALASE